MEKAFPELVSENADGIKGVNYIGLIPYLIKVVKSLQPENEELRKTLTELNQKFEESFPN